MGFLLILTTIIQSFAISLGVGSSTLAIINFFVAISDGKIDDTERKMMGVVYTVLRVAMVLILLSSAALALYTYTSVGVSTELAAQLIVLFVLFLNAILMTVRVMPSTFGPALQAGSWYTLGALSAVMLAGVTLVSLTVFMFIYVTWLVLAISIVNGIMAVLRHRK